MFEMRGYIHRMESFQNTQGLKDKLPIVIGKTITWQLGCVPIAIMSKSITHREIMSGRRQSSIDYITLRYCAKSIIPFIAKFWRYKE